MQQNASTLSYESPKRPNPWAKTSLIGGIVLLLGAFVPICGLAVIPLAWIGLLVGVIGVSLAIWGNRRGLVMSIFGSALCLVAAFTPIGMLGTVPFLAEVGLKIWASNQKQPPTSRPVAATAPSTMPATTTAPAED